MKKGDKLLGVDGSKIRDAVRKNIKEALPFIPS